ncbi:efflux RND transporter periplasmic adaptor subunit [Uliginosibacterium sp. H3]|uniref:Efflux RND transporter periplasmic adaptor subunit n=1 Tax=Uliginosibacterium silvisoli TaxID=3114758 RepID=A0ABU6K605_9RHOO|nr:efflux RND transporter periplasmic adaptor subunit [Uliginosibacterium sp. H3]
MTRPFTVSALASLLFVLATAQAAPPPANASAPTTDAATRSAWAAGSAASSARAREELLGCLLAPTAEAEVGSPVIGVLSRVLVERGDRVKKGQAVAQLMDDVERASADAAAQRFENRAEIAAAKSAYEFAQKKADRARELVDKQFISPQALEQADSEAKVAAMRYAQAQEQRVVARQEMAVARAQLGQRTITSPITGVVTDRYMSAGERVEQKAIAKIVQIDPLRVEVVAPATRFNSIRPGSTARVTPDLAGSTERVARVVLVDPVIDAASNTFRVRLELPNPGYAVPSGLRCKIVFGE